MLTQLPSRSKECKLMHSVPLLCSLQTKIFSGRITEEDEATEIILLIIQHCIVGTGSGTPEVPELPSARKYSWATLSLGIINTETWSSRLGVGRGANNPIP
jgi:hypothetical protein